MCFLCHICKLLIERFFFAFLPFLCMFFKSNVNSAYIINRKYSCLPNHSKGILICFLQLVTDQQTLFPLWFSKQSDLIFYYFYEGDLFLIYLWRREWRIVCRHILHPTRLHARVRRGSPHTRPQLHFTPRYTVKQGYIFWEFLSKL